MAYVYYPYATDGDDGITTSFDADWIEALLGNDYIEAGLGDDVIIAGPETPVAGFSDNDVVYGDTKKGDVSNDWISGGYGNDTLYGDSYERGNGGNDVIFGGLGDDLLDGGEGNDALRGGEGNDFIIGERGDDHLDGGSGADQMVGGVGNDVYYVDNIYDIVLEDSSQGLDTVRSTVSYALTATVEYLALDGTAAINGTGNSLDNGIYGNGANNSISGGAGNDLMYGFMGRDTLTGGAGRDAFAFASWQDGSDTIKDFKVADDDFYIAQSGFGGGLNIGFITAEQFRIGSSAKDSSDRFIYNKSTGVVFFDGDGIGGAAQIQIAKLSTGLAMTNLDFFVGG